MFIIEQSTTFTKWRNNIKDERLRAAVALRMDGLIIGRFGDVKPIKAKIKGIGELRINYGPGYRIYFQRRGNEIILLLCGGTKGTQQRDIDKAQQIAKQWSGKDD